MIGQFSIFDYMNENYLLIGQSGFAYSDHSKERMDKLNKDLGLLLKQRHVFRDKEQPSGLGISS